jgi:hypothetical protein
MTTEDVIVADRYILRAKIGQGSFGEIFLAEDKDDRKNVVAVKMVPWSFVFEFL